MHETRAPGPTRTLPAKTAVAATNAEASTMDSARGSWHREDESFYVLEGKYEFAMPQSACVYADERHTAAFARIAPRPHSDTEQTTRYVLRREAPIRGARRPCHGREQDRSLQL
jgi:hypothetical protein